MLRQPVRAGVEAIAMTENSKSARRSRCQHVPRCPCADASDHGAARVVAAHPEQGWSLLCNGVIVFDDTGEIMPDRRCCAPYRAA